MVTKERKSLPKSDLMDGLFDLDGFFFSSAARQEDGKVNTKRTIRTSRTFLNINKSTHK